MKVFSKKRRMFLQGAGKTMLAIPFLPSILSSPSAYAQSSGNRFFIFFPFNGGVPTTRVRPKSSNVAFTKTGTDTQIRKLTDIINAEGRISEIFGNDWNAYASQMNIITHLNSYHQHNMHSQTIPGCAHVTPERVRFVGGNVPAYEEISEARYSIDHCVRKHFEGQGIKGSLDQIHVNIGYPDEQYEYSEFSYGQAMPGYANSPGQSYLALGNAQQLEALVSGQVSSSNNQPSQPSSDRIKLVDKVLEDYRRLRNDRRISQVDKGRLQQAMDQWNDIQNRWQSGGGRSCTLPQSIGSSKNYTLQNRQTVDLITAAMSCGVTHVAAHAMIQHGSTFPGDGPAHEILHADNYNEFIKMYKWRIGFMKQYADRLTELVDSNGEPLMKSALLFNPTEYADGGLHPLMCKTVITIGSGGGALKTGYHVHAGGAPFQRAHITVMKALGLSRNEIEVGGSPGFGQYADPKVTDDIPQANEVYRSSELFPKFNNTVEKRKDLEGLV